MHRDGSDQVTENVDTKKMTLCRTARSSTLKYTHSDHIALHMNYLFYGHASFNMYYTHKDTHSCLPVHLLIICLFLFKVPGKDYDSVIFLYFPTL